MTDDKIRQLMHERIIQKTNDPLWGESIAKNVFKKRENTRKKIFISFSASSLAAAAIIIIAFLFNLNTQNDKMNYYSFISSQIDGTATMVFKNNDKNLSNNNTSDIDNMINDTLAIR